MSARLEFRLGLAGLGLAALALGMLYARVLYRQRQVKRARGKTRRTPLLSRGWRSV